MIDKIEIILGALVIALCIMITLCGYLIANTILAIIVFGLTLK